VVGGQRHVPAALPPRKTRYPLYRRMGGPLGWSGQVRKIFPVPGFDPRNVQPVASSYTDWTIPATIYMNVLHTFYLIYQFAGVKLTTLSVWVVIRFISISSAELEVIRNVGLLTMSTGYPNNPSYSTTFATLHFKTSYIFAVAVYIVILRSELSKYE
jgi:hypothetical protein